VLGKLHSPATCSRRARRASRESGGGGQPAASPSGQPEHARTEDQRVGGWLGDGGGLDGHAQIVRAAHATRNPTAHKGADVAVQGPWPGGTGEGVGQRDIVAAGTAREAHRRPVAGVGIQNDAGGGIQEGACAARRDGAGQRPNQGAGSVRARISHEVDGEIIDAVGEIQGHADAVQGKAGGAVIGHKASTDKLVGPTCHGAGAAQSQRGDISGLGKGGGREQGKKAERGFHGVDACSKGTQG